MTLRKKLVITFVSFCIFIVVVGLVISWKIAVPLAGFLLLHESGHLWASMRAGLPFGGVVLIPFLGGIAFIGKNKMPKTRLDSFCIYLYGPLVGLFFCIGLLFLYSFTQIDSLLAIGTFLILINTFNLLPINPLDGGCMIKSITFSLNRKIGIISLFASSGLLLIIGALLKHPLFLILSGIPLLEGLFEKDKENTSEEPKENIEPINKKQIFPLIFIYLWLAWVHISILYNISSLPGIKTSLDSLLNN